MKLLGLVIVTVLVIASGPANAWKIQYNKAINYVLNAINRAISFDRDNLEGINLDGVIGLRVVEGKTGALIAHYMESMPDDLFARLRHTQRLAAKTADKGFIQSKINTPVYHEKMKFLIEPHFWDLLNLRQKLNSSLVTGTGASSSTFNMAEEETDDCVKALSVPGACSISRECLGYILKDGMDYYAETHVVFTVLSAVQSGCLPYLERAVFQKAQIGVGDILDKACANIYAKAESLAENVPAALRDLFMEQIGICGEAGYLQFAQIKWLPMILKWQDESGCYKQFADEEMNPRNFDPQAYGNFKKRAEARMTAEDGTKCLAHRTAVALWALSVYLRNLIEMAL